MICKWCGSMIDVRQSACPVCGRDNPPLSDCGGIYNLTQDISDDPTPSETPTKREPDIQSTRRVHPSAPSKGHSHWLLVCGIVLLLLSVVLSLSLKIEVARQYKAMEQLPEKISAALSSNSDVLRGDASTGEGGVLLGKQNTLSSSGLEEISSPQPLSFELTYAPDGTLQFLDFSDGAALSIQHESDNIRNATVHCKRDGQFCWDAILKTTESKENELRLSCALRAQKDRSIKATPAWLFKTKGDAGWNPVEEEKTLFTLDAGELVIDLNSMAEKFDDDVEVKCTYQVKNEQDVTLEISIIQTVPLDAE